MPSRTFHSDPIGDVWYDSAGAGGVASYGLRTWMEPIIRVMCGRLEILTSMVTLIIPTVLRSRMKLIVVV